MNLIMSLATRSRPKYLLHNVGRTIKCLERDDTQIILQIDDDDKETIEALDKSPFSDKRVVVNIAPREDTVGGKINRAMLVPADLYLVGADDDPPVTPGWDAKMLEAASRFDDGIGMVYGHMANLSFSCMVAPTAKLVEKLGYIQPDLFPYWFIDHWTDDIAKIIGRVSYADVGSDQSNVGRTMEMREPSWWATWFDAAYLMRRKVAHDIINSDDFIATANQKEMLLRQHPVLEMRSRWINDNVRARTQELERIGGLRTDEPRYKRVREKHVAMIPRLLNDYGMPEKEAQIYRDYLIPPTSVLSLKKAYA